MKRKSNGKKRKASETTKPNEKVKVIIGLSLVLIVILILLLGTQHPSNSGKAIQTKQAGCIESWDTYCHQNECSKNTTQCQVYCEARTKARAALCT